MTNAALLLCLHCLIYMANHETHYSNGYLLSYEARRTAQSDELKNGLRFSISRASRRLLHASQEAKC